MRRTARALSVTVLAGAAFGLAGTASAAGPAAEPSPGVAWPGTTVSGTCGPAGANCPADGGAVQGEEGGVPHGNGPVVAGEDGAVSLGDDGTASRLDDGAVAPRGDDSTVPWGDSGAGARGEDDGTAARGDTGTGGRGDTGTGGRGDTGTGGRGDDATGSRGDVGGGRECASSDSSRSSRSSGSGHCADDAPTVEHGVEAGAGGTFTDSVPVLVAGAVLIAAAGAGAVYRLSGVRSRADG